MLTLLTPPTESRELFTALIADHDEDTRSMYGEFLRHSGIALEEASDGPDALAKALARAHDVVITDTRLPGISGYQLCELLRRDTATKATPIIVVTGEAFATDVERAHRAGADSVLLKPCLPDVLLAEVRRLGQRAAEIRQQSRQLRERSMAEVARSRELQVRVIGRARGPAKSRQLSREDTTMPPLTPPELLCPTCDKPLTYQRSHVGGVSERHREQWDYYECASGCGTFQYRQRTRKLRHVR